MTSSILPNDMDEMDDNLTFESNKINGPPNSSHRNHQHSSSTTLAGDGLRSLFPKRQMSLKLLSPNVNKMKRRSHDRSTTAFDDIATPKTRGIKLLRKTSSQYNNKEFQKRLSIPSFHVADQILMDILTEQNQSNNGSNLNMIREDQIHEEDDNDMGVIEFMDDDEDDDYSDDTDVDSLMTLDAFPDLPDFGINNDDDDDDDDDNDDDEGSRNLTVVTRSQDAYTPNTASYDDDTNDDTLEEMMHDALDEESFVDTPYEDEDDEDDDDECLTPRTYNKLFQSFHHTDEKKEPEAEPKSFARALSTNDIVVNIGRKNRSLSTKDLAINISSFHKPKRRFSKPLGMRINIVPFKSEGANKSDDELDFAYDDDETIQLQRGFSGLQRAASVKLIQDKDNNLNITTLLRKSASYSAAESTTIINAERATAHLNGNSLKPVQKKMSSAESAIAVAKELLETEILYQGHLKNLQYILLNPIISTYFGNDCISSIFYKLLCDIISVSKSFTMRLAIYVKALQIPQLANWIYFSCKRFGVYAHYAKMYDIFLDRLTLCKDIDDNIEFWIRRQEKCYKTELKNQKLHSLLMMPVQRLPRYILLLEELIKYTQRIEVEEYSNDVGTILFLELAKSEIQTVSQRVNEMVRQRENRSNLKELINRFCGQNKAQLLRSNRVLVYEGFLFKVRKYKIKYYFHLFSDILTYSNINNNGLFNIHRIIYLHKVAIIDLPNVDENIKQKKKQKLKQKQKQKQKQKKYKHKIWYRFLLKAQEKSFELLTENEQEKQNWLLLIKAAISRLTNTNPNNEKGMTPVTPLADTEYPDLDMNKSPLSLSRTRKQTLPDEDCYAPYWLPDDASNKCLLCDAEFSILNRRHHCRRCGTLVCKQCSKTKKLLTNIDKTKPVRICDDCATELETDDLAMSRLTPYASPQAEAQIEINAMRLSEFFPDTNSNPTAEDDDISKQILKYTRQYKHKLRILLEHFCRPIMDVVENNKIIIDFITTKRFYNQSNIKINDKNTANNDNKNERNKKQKQQQSKIIKDKKNKKKELRKKKRKQTLEKNKKNTFSSNDVKAKTILNNLYKLKCGHKTLIALCTIVEQIFDIICLLHSELKLIIFKKHVNYEDDMILDYFELNNCHLNDADHARIGRLFILYTDLFNIHVEYASRFPECYHIIIGNDDKTQNHLVDFIKDVKLSLVRLNKDFILKNLLQAPLDFTRKIYQFLMKINLKIDSSMVNSSDLNLCIKTLKQTLLDLDKEKSQSQQRIKLYKLQATFDFTVDFRERGRTLIVSDFITKVSAKHSHNYYFHLFSNILCYSAKKLGNSKFVFKNYIYLRDIMFVIDGMVYEQRKGKKKIKQNKKRDSKTITIKYSQDIAPFHHDSNTNTNTNMNNIHVITEEDEEKKEKKQPTKIESIKSFSLVFDNKDKKQCWFELLNNLVNEEKGKYTNKIKVNKIKNSPFEDYRNNRHNRNNHLRSRSLTAVKKSKKNKENEDKEQFCGICHSSFNRLYNVSYKCIGCALPICDACCMDNFYLSKKFIAPKYLKLCVRCNYYNHNERSCNILCI